MNASLSEELSRVEWGEYRLGDLFDKRTVKGVPKSCEDLTPVKNGYHIFGQNIKYQYQHKVLMDKKYLQIVEEDSPILAYTSSVGEIGVIKESFYRTGNNGAFQGLFPKNKHFSYRQLQFILSVLKKHFDSFGYDTGMADVINLKFQLPTKNGEIDFDFMERFVAELEAERVAELAAYLKVSGYDNYKLSCEELDALQRFGSVEWGEYKFSRVFNRIEQGRRLKKDDQLLGNIPFVMAGTTNCGVANYISNPVASFPSNSITIDIFGNAFYRNYAFGAGDDTGVYWNDKNQYTKCVMLFFSAAMGKSLYGKFSYGNKLRSSQSLDITMKLPTQNGEIDFEYMETFISAVIKLVIKDVVDFADRKISAAKDVVS